MDKLITVVGLGPGDPGMLPLQVWELLNGGLPVYLRTEVHPTVDWLKQKGVKVSSMDHHYCMQPPIEVMSQTFSSSYWKKRTGPICLITGIRGRW